jgi:ankyrin repeat protein
MANVHAIARQQLYDSAQRGDAVQVQALLAACGWVSKFDLDCALTAAVRNDHANTVAVFAPRGPCAWTTPSCTTLLYRAVRHGSVHVAAFLVAAGASVNGADVAYERPLYAAVAKGQLSCVSLLLAMKASIWAQGRTITALHFAARFGHADVAECLLRAKADHRHTNDRCETPLCLAAACMHEPVMRVLLGARADVNPPSPCRSPLFAAANWPRVPGVFGLLLGARADVNAPLDQEGYTALSVAVSNGCPDTVLKLLLRGKADVNATAMGGYMALHFAARSDRRSAARLLVRAKANVRAKTGSGCTAAAFALDNDHFELAEYLDANAGR